MLLRLSATAAASACRKSQGAATTQALLANNKVTKSAAIITSSERWAASPVRLFATVDDNKGKDDGDKKKKSAMERFLQRSRDNKGGGGGGGEKQNDYNKYRSESASKRYQYDTQHKSHHRKGKASKKFVKDLRTVEEGSGASMKHRRDDGYQRRGGRGRAARMEGRGPPRDKQGAFYRQPHQRRPGPFDEGQIKGRDDFEQIYFPDHMELDAFDHWLNNSGDGQEELLHPDNINQPVPLSFDGSSFADFLQASLSHPTKYGTVSNESFRQHPESTREPYPVKRASVHQQPPKEFLCAHTSFLLVENLLNTSDEVVTEIARKFEVESNSLCIAGPTAIFIGFLDEKKAGRMLRENHLEESFPLIRFALQTRMKGLKGNEEGQKFVKAATENNCVVYASNLPSSSDKDETTLYLLDTFFKDGEYKDIVSEDDIFVTSDSEALIRFPSAQDCEGFLTDKEVASTVRELHKSGILNVYKATRSKEFDKFTGVNRCRISYKDGEELIVEGDLPSEAFYRCHAGVIALFNVPRHVTSFDISKVFQQFCVEHRDVNGSVEFARCSRGQRMGTVYVGFDTDDDFECAVEHLIKNGSSSSDDAPTDDFIKLKGKKFKIQALVEKDLIRGTRTGTRRSRKLPELEDDLDNWEKYIEDDLLQDLIQMYGREVLENTFKGALYQNPSFGALDNARRNERLEPDVEQGARRRQFISCYAQALKDLYTTPENPGLMVQAMYMEGEKVNLEEIDGPRKFYKPKI